ncbi:hypothetical protein GCM10009118_16020 [Wandonia haliotis]|uniref:Uncharacterized protein n=1 Tax=Wandonia haliotis TaxID=574963 RepID=A0ABN1MQN1_9FLAO
MNKGKSKDKLKSFFKRCGQDTPPFFKKLRIAGLVVAAALSALGGYLIVGGTVATAMSQAAVTEDSDCKD